jgi:uncharacterized protein DUF3185
LEQVKIENEKDTRHALHNRGYSDYPLATGIGTILHNKRLHPHTAGHCHHDDPATDHQWQKVILAMNRNLSVALLVAGIVLIIWGVSASESFTSDVSRFFTGSPTKKAIWLLVAGIVATIVGLLGTFRGSKGD